MTYETDPVTGVHYYKVCEQLDGQAFSDGETTKIELSGDGLTEFQAQGLVAGDCYVLSESSAPEGYLALGAAYVLRRRERKDA